LMVFMTILEFLKPNGATFVGYSPTDYSFRSAIMFPMWLRVKYDLGTGVSN